MFPGRDYMDQLHRIIETLGTPSHGDTEYIASEKAKAYIRSLPFKPKCNYRQMFPAAPDLALDLLAKMLTFAPEQRISVDEALAHPYLRLLHDPLDEPVAPTPFDLDFETVPLGKEALRALLWEETCQMHPELRESTPPGLVVPDIKAEAAKIKAQQAESEAQRRQRGQRARWHGVTQRTAGVTALLPPWRRSLSLTRVLLADFLFFVQGEATGQGSAAAA